MQYFLMYKKTICHLAMSICLLLGAVLLDTSIDSMALANNSKEQQKAMKIAEKLTQGKALKSKLSAQGGKKGYKVRILKDGKISHTFIGLEKLK